ncbi:MAG: lycopene cyclase [Candidatus Viridilinea halotolerans]|uniref:Lycopene cyclase n=1 Tax=Candidatus Viridilinea halotolerans TaxID=2491704 RepID=A0A426TQD9_9CHLR|nr:MAG: lycopene cyclase [Candidatus Viridilinea halotolerans]
MSQYDYIITGAGAAGLSLVYHLGQSSLRQHRVLLVDEAPKRRNDRTWSFWEVGAGPFDAVVTRSWDHLIVHGPSRTEHFTIEPYRYKMIEGGDFYRFTEEWVAQQPNITRCYGRVERIEDRPDGAAVFVDGQVHHGRWAFNSIYTPSPRRPTYAHWYQHFKGWVITCEAPIFDPNTATFMDFRVEQGHDVRFVYVLPYDAHTALVEYTFFSPTLVSHEVYDQGLRDYISHHLGVQSYAIKHVEFGVIPMTDMPFARRPSPHVMNIGTAGGMTKASTGYTFQRIQRQSARITASLTTTGQPFYYERPLNYHALMDGVLLHVLDTGREQGHVFFEQLFSRNPPQRVLRFLDEESSLWEDIALMLTVNVPTFLFSSFDLAARRTWANLATSGATATEGE